MCLAHGLDPDRLDDLPWRDVELFLSIEPELATRPYSYQES